MIRLCFVCLGNICRSPTVEGVMQELIDREGLGAHIEIDSAGTGDWHIGKLADSRAREAASARGIELTSTARQFAPEDFARFDYVLAMDEQNRLDLEAMAPDDAAREKIHLMRSFDEASPAGASVPDPYFGGADGFEEVLDLSEAACRGLLAHLRRHHDLS